MISASNRIAIKAGLSLPADAESFIFARADALKQGILRLQEPGEGKSA